MKLARSIWGSQLFRVSALNSFSVVLKIVIGLTSSKVIAVFVGPSGMALVGNLRNFIVSLEAVSTLGFQSGVVKYVAENEHDKKMLSKVLSTIFICLLFVAIPLSVSLYFMADFLNAAVFGESFSYAFVFKALAAAIPWYAFSIILLSVINGLGKFRQVIYINIIGNIIGLLVSVFLIINYRVEGALLSIIIAPSLMFVVTLVFVSRALEIGKYLRADCFSWKIVRNMGSYTVMAAAASVLAPIGFLYVRTYVISHVGLQHAGYWEAMTRISAYYMLFVTSIISVYFLPKLSVASDRGATKLVIYSYIKTVMPVFAIGLTVLYLLRGLVISILFTAEFKPIDELFFWQLAGDLLKAMSLILGYAILAKKATVAFVATEIMSTVVMIISSVVLVDLFDIRGVVMAHAFTYFVYLTVLLTYNRKILF